MRSALEEIALWEVLLNFEKNFLDRFKAFERKFDKINDQNATQFIEQADIIANYVRFFACFQISATFTCKNKVPPGTCFYGIDDLVSRCEDKLTAFLGARLTTGSDTNFDFSKFFAITSKYRSMFNYNLLKNEIALPANQMVVKALKLIPLYQYLLDEDGDSTKIPEVFFTDSTKMKSETENTSPDQDDRFNSLAATLTKMIENQTNNDNNVAKLLEALTQKSISSSSGNDKNSTFNKELVKSINDSNISAHLERWDLREERKFDGDGTKLIFFIRHLVLKAFPNVLKPEDRMTIIQRNVKGDILYKADNVMQTANDLNSAIFDFINELISEFGDRYDIALTTISNFLASISFDPKDKNEVRNFNLELNNFCHLMWFIGESNAIDNIFFLRKFLDSMPPYIQLKWETHVAKNDIHVRRIFGLKPDNSLCYNVTPETREKAKFLDSIDKFSTIACPPEKGSKSHEINFKFKTFVNWFDTFYVKGGMANKMSAIESHCNASYSKPLRKGESSASYNYNCGNNNHNFTRISDSNKLPNASFSGRRIQNSYSHNKKSDRKHQTGLNQHKDIKKFIVNPNLQFKLNATKQWHDGICSIQEDNIGKHKDNLWRLLFIRHHRGCFRCGFNHFTSKCNKNKIPNFPCDHDSHKTNQEKRFFHNSAFHVDNWEKVRNRFLVVKPENTSVYRAMACHSEVNEQCQDVCYDDNDCFDFYAGEFLIDSDFSDINTEFSGTYNLNSDDWLENNESSETVANTMINTSTFDLGFDDSNLFTELPRVVGSFRSFCNVILSNIDRSFQISTILMFDSGSDHSFIDEFARLQTRIDGRSKKNSVRWYQLPK